MRPTWTASPFPDVDTLFLFGVGGGGDSNLATKKHSSVHTIYEREVEAVDPCGVTLKTKMNGNHLHTLEKLITSPKRAINNSEYIAVLQTFRLLHWHTIDACWVHWTQVSQDNLKHTTQNVNTAYSWQFIEIPHKSIQKRFLTSLFSFMSTLQCSLDTWGSWMRMSQSIFLKECSRDVSFIVINTRH